MNNCWILLLLSFLFCGCHHNNNVFSREALAADVDNLLRPVSAILNKYEPAIEHEAETNPEGLIFGNDTLDDQKPRHLLIGKCLGTSEIIAVEIRLNDSIINFYSLKKGQWQPVGSEKMHIPQFVLSFEDLDGDGKNEIVTSTSPNMNGNSWKEIYRLSKTGHIVYAGSFSTDYKIVRSKKQLEETYEGSQYMSPSKTLYEWRNEKLVPIKQVIIVTDEAGIKPSVLEYYENPGDSFDGLKLVSAAPYDNKSKAQRQLWDSFFD